MTWNVIVARSASKTYKAMPKQDKARVLEALDGMEHNPHHGDIIALRGKYQGSYRRRVGSWRLIFDVDTETRTVTVTDIVRRTSKAY